MKPLTVNQDYRALVPRPTEEEYKALEANIIEKGEATEPIITNKKSVILDGHTRYEICTKHGLFYRTDEREFESELDEKIYVIDSNILRRHLEPLQVIELNLIKAPLIKELAKQRMSEAGKAGVDVREGRVSKYLETLDEPEIHTDNEIGKLSGFSHETIRKARKILKDAPEELKQEVRKGEKSISNAFNEIIKEERKQSNEALKAEVKKLEPPQGKFEVIVVDPPWNYGTEYDPDSRRVASPYPEMNVEEIKNIKLPANEDSCMLFLWTTNAFMHDAFHIIEYWGFEPKTILTWVKDRMGIGYWLRGITEHVILAVKGKPAFKLTNQTTVIHAKNLGHSIKPSEFYDFVDGYIEGRKLDYFAREKRVGWETFGTMEHE